MGNPVTALAQARMMEAKCQSRRASVNRMASLGTWLAIIDVPNRPVNQGALDANGRTHDGKMRREFLRAAEHGILLSEP